VCVFGYLFLGFGRGEGASGDAAARVDCFAEIEVAGMSSGFSGASCYLGAAGGGGGGGARFGKVGGWTCARVERLKAFGCVQCDAEMAGKRWSQRCWSSFRVDLRVSK
jgi:hypothetical protein